MEDFGCASAKAVKILAELGTAKGIGLIEKVRRGMGKPDIIYVKNFATIKDTDNLEKEEKEPETNDNTKNFENQNSRVLKNEIQEFRKSKFKSFENQNSRISEIENQEFRKSKCNYTNNNYTEYSYTDINHINHIKDKNDDDKNDNTNETDNLVFLIKKNIDYEHHMKYDDYGKRSLFDELFKVVCDIVCVKREKVRIEKEDYPYELVKSKFLKLDGSHLEYVIDSMQKTTSKIGNLKQYMITALYNAQNTINHHYQQEVRFDEYELE
jgi:hypothetical protein